MASIASKIPLWDVDYTARLETVEIATVKADIAVATQAATEKEFIAAANKLQRDFAVLQALDIRLKQNNSI